MRLKLIKNKLYIILILFIFFLCAFSGKIYATTYTYTNSSNDLPETFENTYPGYLSVLQSLSTQYPSWTFLLYETELDWDTVINSEYCSIHGHGTKVAEVGSSRSGDWLCRQCYNAGKTYDTGRWYCASESAIAYMMDPRNNINSADVFQFLMLSNDTSITKEQIASTVSSVSYLNTESIINAIYNVAQELNINPFYIISKIKQEQGSGRSALCSGNGYNGYYAGYYNLFNIGATGNSESDVILNGLSHAYNKGWDTPEKAIKGGLGTTILYYINRGQNTPYYQDFNVITQSYYYNQYATNVQDAWGVGNNIRKCYAASALLNQNLTFLIPLYKNMLPEAEIRPLTQSQIDEKVASSTDYLTVDPAVTLSLRYRPSLDATPITYASGGTIVTRLTEATYPNDGFYWDYVILSDGTTGYMTRETADKKTQYLLKSIQYKIDGENIITIPGTTISDIEGATLTGETFGTGAEITLNEETYTLIMLGDVNGDAEVDIIDLALLKRHLIGQTILENEYNKAGMLQDNATEIDIIDLALLKRHLTAKQKIVL